MAFLNKLLWVEVLLFIVCVVTGQTWWCELYRANHGTFLERLLDVKTMADCQKLCLDHKVCKSVMTRLSSQVCYLMNKNWLDNNYSEDQDIHLCEIASLGPCGLRQDNCTNGATCLDQKWGLFECIVPEPAVPFYLDGDLKSCQSPFGEYTTNSTITFPIHGRPPIMVSIFGEKLKCIPQEGILVSIATECNNGCHDEVCIPLGSSTNALDDTLCQFKCPTGVKTDYLALHMIRPLNPSLFLCEIKFD